MMQITEGAGDGSDNEGGSDLKRKFDADNAGGEAAMGNSGDNDDDVNEPLAKKPRLDPDEVTSAPSVRNSHPFGILLDKLTSLMQVSPLEALTQANLKRFEDEKRQKEAMLNAEAEEERRTALLAQELEDRHRRFKVRCSQAFIHELVVSKHLHLGNAF
jgi:hypothetical protein